MADPSNDPTVSRSPVFLGLDAGGSHTEAVLAAADGTILGRAEGPGAGMRPGGAAASAAVMADTARRAAASAGARLPAQRLVVGAAGAGRAPEQAELAAALVAAGVTEAAEVMGDGELALLAAFGGGPGILVTAGTGSIAYARDPAGRLRRAGGFGWQMGDEGGGYWLGRRALAAAGRAQDGRDDQSTLPTRLLGALGLKEFDDLVRWAALAAPAQIAALAPHLVSAATEGERAAQAAVRDAAAELTDHVVALRRRFPPDMTVDWAMGGGLLRPGSVLADALRAAVQQRELRLRFATAAIDPAAVAAGRAAREAA
jgi:N-acetylglucosamine kinase-like BadF-type ATPase